MGYRTAGHGARMRVSCPAVLCGLFSQPGVRLNNMRTIEQQSSLLVILFEDEQLLM